MAMSIPEEIILEIFSKLPGKSLIRFMSVHKSWYALIKSPKFVSMQRNNTRSCLAFRSCPQDLSFCYDDHGFRDHLHFLILGLDPNITIVVGTCKGLFCIFNSQSTTIVLWNPSIRKWITLPKPDSSRINFFRFNHYEIVGAVIGFGFLASTSDYKVVYLDTEHGKNFAKVYSVKEGFWKTLTCFAPSGIECRYPQVLANNKLHWLVSENSFKSTSFVLVFDLEREFFQQIMMPDSICSESCHSSLHCLRSSIALAVHRPWRRFSRYRDSIEKQDIDVFVMKNLGTVNTWKKTISLKGSSWRVFGFRSNGQLLIMRWKKCGIIASFKLRKDPSYDLICDSEYIVRDCSFIGTYEENLALLDNKNVESDADLQYQFGIRACDVFVEKHRLDASKKNQNCDHSCDSFYEY